MSTKTAFTSCSKLFILEFLCSMYELFIITGQTAASEAQGRAADGDLLSVLLEKGNKLREQMIISSLESKSKAGSQTVQEPAHFQPMNGHRDRKEVDVSVR